MVRVGIDVIAKVGKPVRIEDNEGLYAAFLRPSARLSQRPQGAVACSFQGGSPRAPTASARSVLAHSTNALGDIPLDNLS